MKSIQMFKLMVSKLILKDEEDEIITKIVEESYKLSKTSNIDILVNNAGITERYPFEDFHKISLMT